MNEDKKSKTSYMIKIMCVVIIFLIIGIIAVAVKFYGKNQSDENAANTYSEETEGYNNTQTAAENGNTGELSGDSSILFICTEKRGGDIIFISLADFKILSETIVITPFDPGAPADEKTYGEHYAYGGADELVEIVEKVRNINIDRYVIIDKDGFCAMADIMGKVSFNVEEDFTCEASDKTYTVSAGENELDSSMLYSYIKFNAQKQNSVTELADIFCEIVNAYMKNVETEDSQKYFEDLSNCIDSNITISDYYSAKEDINYLLSHNAKCVSFEDIAR